MDRAVNIRIKDFNEVDCGLTQDEAIIEANRCIQCKKPKCITGCPVGVDIPAFISACKSGDFKTAVQIIKLNNIFPAICGRVCPQETQCQGMCILGKHDKPIAIGKLERFVADMELQNGIEPPKKLSSTGKRICVVGSGPAGLSAAAELLKLGHHVTIFESLHELGGVLMYGIPEFRLPKHIVMTEIDQIVKLGAEIHTNYVVGQSVTIPELLSYDAVFIGTGAGLPYFMGIPGENLCGIYSANEYLTRVNLMGANKFPENTTPIKKGKNVVVIGGGNVAMDAARVARRLGGNVTLMYRRSELDMPARREEIRHAKEEGIEFLCCANPIKFISDDQQNVVGIEAIKMRLGSKEPTGKCSCTPINGSNFRIDADVVIEAIGQGSNTVLLRKIPDLDLKSNGCIIVDGNGQTNVSKVYAGGDITSGAATVILAMGTAKIAAQSINKMLCTSNKI